MQKYLIDGYNLGHKIPEVVQLLKRKDFYAAIERIVHIVEARLNARRNRVIIVFDGKKGLFDFPRNSFAVEIIFSRKPQEADDIIRDILRHEPSPSDWTVISSDNEILRTARDLGAKFIRSESFVGSQTSSSEKYGLKETRQKYDPENVDVNYWLRLFGSDDDAP